MSVETQTFSVAPEDIPAAMPAAPLARAPVAHPQKRPEPDLSEEQTAAMRQRTHIGNVRIAPDSVAT